ncbi:MAG: ATP-binding cassette domain-containing protein, partial [Actinomycetota bacterium]|nr:ATP-binding cassette domain-containing protein [Actinomycetota bacterium]
MVDDVHHQALLAVHGLVKHYPGAKALDGVDLEVRAGEVHCLLGQNGAGKSTLIKVLAGAHQPDAGEITWQGRAVSLSHPQAAMSLGIATIYQELDLVPGLTVADNVFLGREHAKLGLMRPAAAHRETTRLLERLGHQEIRPGAEVATLSAAGQQMVSIARALSQDARLIIMDEPSAVLDNEEVARLFGVIRDLRADGVAVLYISHRLEEIREIGDRTTILKDGRTVATGLSARDTPTREVITLMTGRDIEYVFSERREAPSHDVAPLLEVSG